MTLFCYLTLFAFQLPPFQGLQASLGQVTLEEKEGSLR